jgi:hypothetical protein
MAEAPFPTEQILSADSQTLECRGSELSQQWPFADRRSRHDRRHRPTRWYDSLLGHRRRKRGRRKGESRNIYVDLYHSSDLIILGLVFLLNLLDAVLTLVHLSNGGVEQNPAMAELLRHGPLLFILQKCFVVALCLAAMIVHKTFRIARMGAWILLSCYTGLAIWHLTFLL